MNGQKLAKILEFTKMFCVMVSFCHQYKRLWEFLSFILYRMADCDVKQKEARAEYQGMR